MHLSFEHVIAVAIQLMFTFTLAYQFMHVWHCQEVHMYMSEVADAVSYMSQVLS